MSRVDKDPTGEYSWTNGGNQDISHLKMIDAGGFGTVHQVSFLEFFYPDSLDVSSKEKSGRKYN